MLKTQGLQSLEQIRAFVEGAQALGFEVPAREAAYDWIAGELRRLGYTRLGKTDKGLVRRYLVKVTDLSRAQLTRLIKQFRSTGASASAAARRRYPSPGVIRRAISVCWPRPTPCTPPSRGRPPASCVSAPTRCSATPATRLCLAGISNGHLYNLRASQGYQRLRASIDKTHPLKLAIGKRRKPRPEGRPGFPRVDSVHQGDMDGIKSLYPIHLVDEVTQFQFVGSAQRISERFLLPVLKALLEAFPFLILGFHADKGRIRKRYHYENMMPPYDKLKSLPDAGQYLKPAMSFEQLNAIAYAISDNEAARRLNQARAELFRSINKTQNPAA